MRKEGDTFFSQYGAAHGHVQEPTPGSTSLFGLKTLSKTHPMVKQQNIAGSWAWGGGGRGGGGGAGYPAAPAPGLSAIGGWLRLDFGHFEQM